MPRFKLDAKKTAAENLWEAARVASVTLLRKHNWYGFHDQMRDDLFDAVMYGTVRHFIEYKVKRHRYNRNFDFCQNVISSCWSCCNNIADKFIQEFDRDINSVNIECVQYSLKKEDVPIYANKMDIPSRKRPPKTSPYKRAYDVRDEYRDYMLECEYMGVEQQSMESWLVSTGYSQDPGIMWYLEDDIHYRYVVAKQVKRKWILPEGLEFLRRDGRKK